MPQFVYALLGMTALVAALVALLTFVALRFAAAVRDRRGQLREGGQDRLFMAAALEDALAKLRAQERATAERAAASERLSEEIVTSLTAGLLVAGMNRGIRILNPAGRRLLRLAQDPPADDYRILLARAPALTAVIDECLVSGRPMVRKAIEMPHDASAATHLGVTISPMFDNRGEMHGAICLFTDLTEVMDLEEQLRLKDSLARLGELTAGLAHEFRNGLATIHGYSRLIEIDALPEAYRPYLQSIRDETDSLEAVVTNFLNFARPTQLTLAPVDLGAVADRVVAEARADRLVEQGTITCEGTFATVDGDEVLLRQALGNLLRNALEACAAAKIPPRITIAGEVDHAQAVARLTVSDNGPGVSPAVRERIFRPFVTTKPDGTGLGLAIVQKIIVTHNGRVALAPHDGPGARFLITLPIRP
ncbi:MAG: GHKL domain-containing protein [Acidobacteria bacterium]|nr:GHKL domain-containing protein [Acidobacteriota bacterium]